MARAATETQKAGLTGLEFGLAIPGTVGGAVWANAGAHEIGHRRRPRVGRACSTADGTEAIVPAARPRPGLPRQPVQARPPATAPRRARSSARPSDLEPADPDVIKARLDDIRRWRQAHQPLGLPSAGSVFRNPAGDSAGAAHRGGRAQGPPDRRRGRLREARQLHRQRPEGHGRRRPPRWASTSGPWSRERHGVELVFEIVFLGDWDGWPWRREPTPSCRRSSSCSAARRPSTTSRSCRARRSPPRSADAGVRRRAGPHRSRRRAGGGCRPTIGATTGRAAAYDDPAALGADGPVRGRGRRRPAARPRTRRRSSSSRSTARSARTARSRRCSRRPGSPTRARASPPRRSAWTRRCSSGSCRGLGLPVVDWREVRARALGARTAPASSRELAAFAAGAGDPRLMVKPAAPRQLGRDDAGPRPGRAGGGARPRVPLRHARARRGATCAGARDLEVAVIGNDPAALELYGPGEIVAGHEFYDYAAKYTPGLSETSTRAEVERRPAGDASSSSPATRTGRSAPRASPGSTSCSPASAICPLRDQHDPGVHADQPLPDDAGRGRLRLRRRLPPHRRARASSAMRPGRRRACGPATCRDDPPPAAAVAPTRPEPTDDAALQRRAGPPDASIRRASAGLIRVRAGAILVVLCCRRRRSTASPTRRRSRTRRRPSRAPPSPTRPRSGRRSQDARGENLFGLVDAAAGGRASGELPTVALGRCRGRAAGRPRRPYRRARADPRLARRRAALSRRREGPLRQARRGAARRARRRSPSSRTAARASGRFAVGRRSTRRSRRRDPAGLAEARGRRQRGRAVRGHQRRERLRSARGRPAGRPSSGSTRRPCARPS